MEYKIIFSSFKVTHSGSTNMQFFLLFFVIYNFTQINQSTERRKKRYTHSNYSSFKISLYTYLGESGSRHISCHRYMALLFKIFAPVTAKGAGFAELANIKCGTWKKKKIYTVLMSYCILCVVRYVESIIIL